MQKTVEFRAIDAGLSNKIAEIKQRAEEMARSLISDARGYSSSGKEVLNFLDQQIKLLERRDALEKRMMQRHVEQRLESGEITEKQAKQQILKIESGSKDAEIHNELLRELIETVRDTARREISEDRKLVEKQISSDKTISRLGIQDDEDEFEALKRTIQHEEIGRIAKTEKQEVSDFENRAANVAGQVGQLGQAQSGYHMLPVAIATMGSLFGSIGAAIGSALAGVTQRLLSAAENAEAGMAVFGAQRGSMASAGSASQYGITMAELSNFGGRVGRGLGYAPTPGSNYNNPNQLSYSDLYGISKGYALDEGTMFGSLRTYTRDELRHRMGAEGTIQAGAVSLQAAGLVGKNDADYGFLNDYMQILNSYNQQSLTTLGSIDSALNDSMIGYLATMSEVLQHPDVLAGVTQKFQGALSKSGSSQMNALQLHTLAGLDPTASLFELEKMRERGMSTPGYMENMLTNLKGVSYGDEDFFRNIANVFDLSYTLAEEIGKGFMNKTFTETDFQAKMLQQAGLDPARGAAVTGNLTSATAATTDAFVDVGLQLVSAVNNLVGQMSQFFSMIQRYGNSPSDERLKSNITQLQDVLPILLQLQGYSYQFKSDKTKKEYIGFIAQEVEQVLPQVVETDSDGFKSINYGLITALLVEVLKLQNSRIEKLEQKI